MNNPLFSNLTKIVLIAILALANASAQVQNLVKNPGFETRDFTDWMVVPATVGSTIGIAFDYTGDYGIPGGNHSYQAYFGAYSVYDDAISQVIATSPGATYTFSFDLGQVGGLGYSFVASWDGTPVLNFVPTTAESDMTPYTYEVTATTDLTTVQLQGRNGIGFFFLDNVSVIEERAAAPEPATLALIGMAALPVIVMIRSRKV